MRLNETAQAEMLEHKLKKLLADQRFSRLVMVGQEEWTCALQKSNQNEL